MNRADYLFLMRSKVKNRNLQKHMLATEVILKELAPRFGGNRDEWGLAGLLHDIDYETTALDPAKHGLKGAEILEGYGLPEYVLQAIRVHPGVLPRTTDLDKALYATDPLTGLIVAAALIHKDRKLASLDLNFIINRFKERSFAKGASRDQIKSCAELGLELEEFIALGLKAMQLIADDLGL